MRNRIQHAGFFFFLKENIWVIIAHLQPLSFHQALKASDGPAGWIQDDLSQGGHLQRGVRPFSTVNKNRRSLPKTAKSQFVAPASFLHHFMCLQTDEDIPG